MKKFTLNSKSMKYCISRCIRIYKSNKDLDEILCVFRGIRINLGIEKFDKDARVALKILKLYCLSYDKNNYIKATITKNQSIL